MESRRLRRSRRNRWLVGVCGGFGERYGFPPLILRLALIAAGVFFTVPVLFAYLIGWLLIPEELEEFEPWPQNQSEEGGDESGAAGEASAEVQLPEGQGEASDPWAR